MSWLEARDQVLARLRDSSGDDKPVFCLLGPCGSGKTRAVQDAITSLRAAGTPAVCLDLRRCPESAPDKFFAWAFAEMREKKWPVPVSIASPRLEFVRTLLKAAQAFETRAVLALDHVESLPDEVAREDWSQNFANTRNRSTGLSAIASYV